MNVVNRLRTCAITKHAYHDCHYSRGARFYGFDVVSSFIFKDIDETAKCADKFTVKSLVVLVLLLIGQKVQRLCTHWLSYSKGPSSRCDRSKTTVMCLATADF